jgi:hypothetical protein
MNCKSRLLRRIYGSKKDNLAVLDIMSNQNFVLYRSHADFFFLLSRVLRWAGNAAGLEQGMNSVLVVDKSSKKSLRGLGDNIKNVARDIF